MHGRFEQVGNPKCGSLVHLYVSLFIIIYPRLLLTFMTFILLIHAFIKISWFEDTDYIFRWVIHKYLLIIMHILIWNIDFFSPNILESQDHQLCKQRVCRRWSTSAAAADCPLFPSSKLLYYYIYRTYMFIMVYV